MPRNFSGTHTTTRGLTYTYDAQVEETRDSDEISMKVRRDGEFKGRPSANLPSNASDALVLTWIERTIEDRVAIDE